MANVVKEKTNKLGGAGRRRGKWRLHRYSVLVLLTFFLTLNEGNTYAYTKKKQYIRIY